MAATTPQLTLWAGVLRDGMPRGLVVEVDMTDGHLPRFCVDGAGADGTGGVDTVAHRLGFGLHYGHAAAAAREDDAVGAGFDAGVAGFDRSSRELIEIPTVHIEVPA